MVIARVIRALRAFEIVDKGESPTGHSLRLREWIDHILCRPLSARIIINAIAFDGVPFGIMHRADVLSVSILDWTNVMPVTIVH